MIVKTVCQVCGRKAKDVEVKIMLIGGSNWMTHYLQMGDVVLELLTCPTCKILPFERMLNGFQNRVRGGHELDYH